MLRPHHPVRIHLDTILEHQAFNGCILLAIAVGTVLLAYEGPPGSIDNDTQFTLDVINHALFAFFLIEFLLKCIAYGFCFTPYAYLKDPWNKIDFTVVLGGALTYAGGDSQLVKLLRCLRPLRIINRNKGMRVIISAVINSLAVNLGVLALSLISMLIFAILGVTIFAGKYYACNCIYAYPAGITPATAIFNVYGEATDAASGAVLAPKPVEVLDKHMCIGESKADEVFGLDPNFPNAASKCYWDNRPYNFDNVRLSSRPYIPHPSSAAGRQPPAASHQP
jgi:hypothetical protein